MNRFIDKAVLVILTLTLLFYPVIFKLKLVEGVFLHPFELFMGVLWILLVIKGIWSEEFRKWVLGDWVIGLYLFLIGIFITASFYGVVVSGVFDLKDLFRALKYLLYFSIYPATFLIIRKFSETYLKNIWKWVIYLSIIPALYSLSRISTFVLSGGELSRWLYDINRRSLGFFGQYIDQNGINLTSSGAHGVYGIYVSLILLAILILLLTRSRHVSIKKLLLIAAINVTALVFTFARMGWVILLVGSNFIVWRKMGLKVWLIFFAVSISLILILAGLFHNSELVIKFTETVSLGNEGVQFDASSAGRVAGWEDSFKLIFSSLPFFLVGVGYSQYNLLFLTEGKLRIIHSSFLDTWVRAGLPAFVVFVALWGQIWLVIRAGYRNKLTGFSRDILILTEAFFIPFLINNLISGGEFFSDAIMLYWWFLIGSVSALSSINSLKNENK